MIGVLILSFQGRSASLNFPLREPSLMWFDELFNPRSVRATSSAPSTARCRSR
jgi:putative spermidine/putrescine transport system permease protein